MKLKGSIVGFAILLLSLAMSSLSAGAVESKLVLGTWAGPDSATGVRLQELADGFNQSQDEVEIEVQQIPGYNDAVITRLVAGVAPDIIVVRNNEVLALSDFLVDLRPYVERSSLDPDDFLPGLLDTSSGNKMVRVPGTLGLLNFVIFYRPSMFDEAGLVSPVEMDRNRMWTWNGVLDVAKSLTIDESGDGVPEQYGIWIWKDYIHSMLARQNGGYFISQDGLEYTGDQSAYTDAIQWVADLGLVHGVRAPVDIAGGDVAMSTWPLERRTQIRQLDLDWDVAPMFNRPERGPFLDITGNGFGITTNSQRPDLAWQFIEWSLGAKGQLITAKQGALPGRLDAIQSEEFLSEPGVENMPYTADVLITQFGSFPFGEGEGGTGVFPEINRLYFEALGQVESGEKLASVAFSEIGEAVVALLEQQR